ncbi:winged helix-turn-helix transcriptional regulator [Thermoguttaceae bacterium LCP21S3_D4]
MRNILEISLQPETEFLEKFLDNLLLDGNNELHNREMHISGKFLLGHCDLINDPINDPIKLAEREKQIIELLRKEPDLTRGEMAQHLHCSDSTVKRTLQTMVEKGVIRRIGSNKKGEWIVVLEEC